MDSNENQLNYCDFFFVLYVALLIEKLLGKNLPCGVLCITKLF